MTLIDHLDTMPDQVELHHSKRDAITYQEVRAFIVEETIHSWPAYEVTITDYPSGRDSVLSISSIYGNASEPFMRHDTLENIRDAVIRCVQEYNRVMTLRITTA